MVNSKILFFFKDNHVLFNPVIILLILNVCNPMVKRPKNSTISVATFKYLSKKQ